MNKKRIAVFALICALVFTLAACAAPGPAASTEPGPTAAVPEQPLESRDLKAFFDTMFPGPFPEGVSIGQMIETDDGMLQGMYPDLRDIEFQQMVAYAAVYKVTHFEVVLAEAKNAEDAALAKDIFDARIERMSNEHLNLPSEYIPFQHASVAQTYGNYVALIVGVGAADEYDAFVQYLEDGPLREPSAALEAVL